MRPASSGVTGSSSSSIPSRAELKTAPARHNVSQSLHTGRMRNPFNMTQAKLVPEQMGDTGMNFSTHAGDTMQAAAASSSSKKATYALQQPLRVKLPLYLNTPNRAEDGVPLTPHEKFANQKKISDMEILMLACRRSGRLKDEGRAAFGLGVLYDNLKMFKKAARYYTTFLQICRTCKDEQGASLAYHCLAVSFQSLGTPEDLKTAVHFHEKHRESADSVGKFIAHANMGTCYGLLKQHEKSMLNNQYALRYALQLHSVEGQSLAVGHLAVQNEDLSYAGDPNKMKALIERYIELQEGLHHYETHSKAFEKLGALMVAEKNDFDSGIKYLHRALDAAKNAEATSRLNTQESESAIAVSLGIATGQSMMQDFLSKKLADAQAQTN